MGSCCSKTGCCGVKKGTSSDQALNHQQSVSSEPGSEDFHLAQHRFTSVKLTREQKIARNMASASLVHEVLDTKDFEEQLKEAGNKLVVVDFFATWCGPCKIIGPKLDVLAGQFTEVIFLKVDVDECEEIATKYTISCMPTFLFFKSGEKIADFSGANSEKVKELILQHK